MRFIPKIKEKRWSPNVESEIFNGWQRESIFHFEKDSKKALFSIDTPPPYVNTPVHIGHAYTYIWMDVMARYRRMLGYNVLFPMGLDKNGLPIEVQTEKEYNIKMNEVPRQEFIIKCKNLLKKYGDISLDTFKRLGLSCNSWEIKHVLGGRYDTDDPEYRRLTQETFIYLWKKGLVYEGIKTTNYCPVCKTAISDAEVDYKEDYTNLNYIKFKVKESQENIVIATTRPELLCTCKVVLFNPEDDRYKRLKGNHVIVPIYNHEVKIIAHPYAKMEFGTGFVMMCSYGDYNDIRLLRELDMKPTYAIDKDGKMNNIAGKYKGLSVLEARDRIVKDLDSMGLLVKNERIMHREPICERSKDPIEFIPTKELYLKQVDYKDEILKISDEMNFYSRENKQILVDWINSINIDWVLSRRRYYGTEIPIWYCKKCGKEILPEPGRYYQPWKEKCPVNQCPKCGNEDFVGEERIFDTWFDSSTSEVYILGYLWGRDYFNKEFPCSMRPQGKEIVRNWLYFTILKSYHLFRKKPFENVWIHMHVVDEKGEKMSKSKGNVIDPQDVIKKFGAEGFRIWTCLEGNITRGDIKCSFQRIEGHSKFLTKLWNIARFISMFPRENAEPEDTDRWILGELSKLIEDVKKSYDEYAFNDVATSIRDFTWNVFASNYVEMVKGRAYGQFFSKKEQRAVWFTLHECLENILLLLAPIIPFFTEHVWSMLYGGASIHLKRFPKVKWSKNLNKLTQKILDFNSFVWNKKKEEKLSLKNPIEVKVPEELMIFFKDLKVMHNIIK
ncbi:MAG: valine--tRNA ligase [Candidatus Methylarchaceae archaeon HK02M2]|nr:valine--tRNA ligase [Candidatus Methylarchaceae archaeon HK02M2]